MLEKNKLSILSVLIVTQTILIGYQNYQIYHLQKKTVDIQRGLIYVLNKLDDVKLTVDIIDENTEPPAPPPIRHKEGIDPETGLPYGFFGSK